MKNIKMIGMSVVLVCSIILVNWNFIPAQADANLVFYLPTDEGSGLLPATSTQTSTFGEVDYAKITVLMDNNGNGSLKSGHGLSILVETHNLTILLDSGLSDLLLKQNVEDLGKNLSLVDFAVISHEHFDHIDGMPYFAEVNPNATVYVPAGMASAAKTTLINLNLSVVDIAASTILSPGVAIIGQLNGPPMEQALTINIANIGQVILVGCSHPGVENIVSKAINDFGANPFMVMGGFHYPDANYTITKLLELGVKKIFAMHCSGHTFQDVLQQNFTEYYGGGCVGCQLLINQETNAATLTNCWPPTSSTSSITPITTSSSPSTAVSETVISTTGYSYLSIVIFAVFTLPVIFLRKRRRETNE